MRDEVKARCEGKTAMLFVGGSRAHHYQELFREIGMETIAAGYEFAHRDDYEGRRVLPGLKVDADSRNIEELHVEPDPNRFQPRLSEADIDRLEKAGIKLSEYEGMMAEMENGALVIDDISQFETERLIELYQPDIICAGIKEKYIIQKSGVPMKQLHSYDSGGPYAGFQRRRQLLPGDRPHGQQQGLEVSEGALAGESRTGRQICVGMSGGLRRLLTRGIAG